MSAADLGLHDPWLFAFTVLVLNATPGVDLVLTVSRTLRDGVRGGLAVALGIVGGCLVHALAAAFGLAALLAASADAFRLVKWAGALYLLWLGVSMLRQAHHAGPASAPGDHGALKGRGAEPAARLFRQGLLTNLLNPKVAIFFLALMPQFIATDAPHHTLAFVALGAWFALQSLAFLGTVVLLVAPLARRHARAGLSRGMQALGGFLFVGLAARLALTERP